MKPKSPLHQFLPLSSIILAGTAMVPAVQAADLPANTSGTISGTYDNAQVGYRAGTITNTVNSGTSLSIGSGASNYLLIGVGHNSTNGIGTLNVSAADSFTANVGNLYVGICAWNNPILGGTTSNGATGTGTLNLGVNNTITAATKFLIGGGDAETNSGMAGGNVGTVTTASSGTTTIYTPLMQLGTAKGNTGTFTLGTSAALNLGTTGSRTALDLGIKLTAFNGGNRTVGGTMNLGASGGVADLNLSRLRLSYNTIEMGGATLDGTLTLSNSASNKLNIVGAGNVVSIGVATGTAGSFSAGTATGLLTIGNLHADSYIESTNNGTAILIGTKPSGAGASINGTLDFKAGSMTIKTTGAAIAGGNGTANLSRLYVGETGNVTLKAGASSSNWITGLTVAEIKSNGLSINTNSYDIGISQAFSGAGGLTKAGLGTMTLSTVQGYGGATNVTGGTLAVTGTGSINSSSGITVSSGAKFAYNSSVALTKAVILSGNTTSNRAVLGGTGPIGVGLTLDNVGDVLSPGNSPGIQAYTVGQTWNSFTYDWEVNDFSAITGLTAGSDFDQITINGTLNLTGGSGSYVLNLFSLTAGNENGEVPNFSEMNRTWNILTASSITGFNAANWTIVTDPAGPGAFTSNPAWGGSWSLGQDGGNLVLSYNTAIPEPGAALLGGLGMLMLLRRRR